MGIYSDKCESCGYKVKKRAKFCSRCGTPAPGSWVKCHNCRKWIGSESEYCPYCKAPQNVSERESIEEGIIRRNKGIFIQRFDLNKIRSRLGKEQKIILEHGNIGILMVDGKVIDTLYPGSYNLLDGVFKQTKNQTQLVLLLIDSGVIVFPYSIHDVKTKDGMSVNIYCEVILKLAGDSLPDLIYNRLKDNNNRLSYSDFWTYFKTELNNTAMNICVNVVLADLLENSEVRYSFEEKFGDSTNNKAASLGMFLERISAIYFYGSEYERLRKISGDVELKTREATFERQARKQLIEGKIDKVKNEQELQVYLDEMAFEYDLEKSLKQNKFELFREELLHELNLKKMQNQHELHSSDSEFRRKEALKDTEYDIVKDRKIFAGERERRKINHQDEIEETEEWIRIRAIRDAQKLESEKERMEVYSKYSLAELATVISPAYMDKVIEARKAEDASKLESELVNLSPEKILAMKSDKSDEAAKALAEITRAKSDTEKKVAEAKAQMAEKAVEQMERILKKML